MKKQLTKGFTLIELLVVISIIGLLSSIVLGALSEARDKGEDSKKLQMVSEWKKALELYYDANGQYPATSTLTNNNSNFACLGSGYSPASCVLTGQVVAEPNTSLSAYYSGLPIPEANIDYSGFNIGGIGYKCGLTNNDCSGYVLTWYQQGDQCGEGQLNAVLGTFIECLLIK